VTTIDVALAVVCPALPASAPSTVGKIRDIEMRILEFPQLEVQTEHVLHAGMYARTVRLPAGAIITSVLIKVPTMLIVNGSCKVLAGDNWVELDGYNVMAACGGRKQIYITLTAVEITMMFPTKAKTVEEAEREFSDECGDLLSRKQNSGDIVIVTGVEACQV
jgi:hypothetical protein